MTPAQLAARNLKIAEGQRRAWRDPDIRARRSAAIAKAYDDPLLRATMSATALKRWGKNDDARNKGHFHGDRDGRG